MEIKRIIFDVDKTLIGGIDFSDTVRKVLLKHDLYNEKNVESFVKGMISYEQTHDSYQKDKYLKHISSSIGINLSMDVLENYLEELRYCVPAPIPGVKEAISNLKDGGYELVVLTNYFSASQNSRLETLGLSKYFSHIYGENKTKPCKESYIEACGKNSVEECLMVGDNYIIDVEVPHYLGLNVIYVTGLDKKITKEYTEVKTVKDIDKELILKMK